MLEIKYNFLGRVLRPLTNRAIETDTDSMYLALTESTINKCMTAEACDLYTNWVHKNCSERDYVPDDVFKFLPRICCENIRSLIIERLVSSKLNEVVQEWFV